MYYTYIRTYFKTYVNTKVYNIIICNMLFGIKILQILYIDLFRNFEITTTKNV